MTIVIGLVMDTQWRLTIIRWLVRVMVVMTIVMCLIHIVIYMISSCLSNEVSGFRESHEVEDNGKFMETALYKSTGKLTVVEGITDEGVDKRQRNGSRQVDSQQLQLRRELQTVHQLLQILL